jgi:type IV pilus assembly protein PilC
MVYPVVVMIAAAGIVAFLMIQVIPQFERIFKEMMQGASLPVLTRLVIAISRGFTKHYIQMGVGIAVVVISFKGLVRTAKGKLVLDKFKLAAPIFGDLVQKTAVARFSRTLGTLMTNGVPLLQALNIVRDTSGNEIVARAIAKIHDSVKEGESMSAPMESSKIFPPIVISMVDVGEETGKTPEMLIKIADNYEEEVDRAVDALTSVLEPLMIVMLAVVIGVIVIAMFVPLISIIGDMAGQN